MVTPEQICAELGLEPEWYVEDESIRAVVNRAYKAAVARLVGEVGYSDGILDDPRAERLIVSMTCDLYEFRDDTEERTTRKSYSSHRLMNVDMRQQLRCEYCYPQMLGIEDADYDSWVEDLTALAEADAKDETVGAYQMLADLIGRWKTLYGGEDDG